MLHENVFGSKPDESHLKNYMISQFLIREYQFYKTHALMLKKQGKRISEDEKGKLLMNIQDYNYTKSYNVTNEIINLIGLYCN